MNGAQRAAFNDLVKYGDVMAMLCKQMADMTVDPRSIRDLQQRWDAARNRYFELEAEARNAKSSARKSRGAVRQRGVTK